MEMQTNLTGNDAEKAFDMMEKEQQELDIEHSPYFRPDVDKTYTLTFAAYKIGMKQYQEKDKKGNLLVDKDGTKVMGIPRSSLTLWVDSINGEVIDKMDDANDFPGKEWTITSKMLISSLRLQCTSGNITKKKYQIRKTGKDFQTKYAVAEAGDR